MKSLKTLALLLSLTFSINLLASPNEEFVTTEYIPGFGQVSIFLIESYSEDEARVHFYHDPNDCGLDIFGNPISCTELGVVTIETTAYLISSTENDEESLYGFTDLPQYQIVTNNNNKIKLLILDDNGDIINIIPMFFTK